MCLAALLHGGNGRVGLFRELPGQHVQDVHGQCTLLGKVYFHRLVIPVSVVVSNLIAFGIQFLLFLVVIATYRMSGADFTLRAGSGRLPLLLLVLAGYGFGGGIIVCALTTRYRDLRLVVTFGLQLLMYLTPVIYPLSGGPSLQWASRLNPLTPVFEGFRQAFLGWGRSLRRDQFDSGAVMVGC